MHRNLVRISAAALLVATAAAACAPVRTHSGFRADYNNRDISLPEVGVDTKDTITQRFGTPSTTAVFDQTTWYYVSSQQERLAFYPQRTTDRRVMAVKFDANNVVSAVENYGLDRGRIIAYNDNVTPTRGRELGVLEQIFGNIGSTPPIRMEEEQQGGRRNRD